MGRMVSRAIPAALSDVLGRAFSLFALTICGAAGTSRRSHHPESARSALHRYSDEFHVPQRSVVVRLDADSTLLDFSPALSRSAPVWSMLVFVNSVCRRIFRALHVACRLAAKWPVGVRWFRDLSFARVRARHVTRHVAHPISCTHGMAFTSRRGTCSWAYPLPCGAAALSRSLRVYLRRFRYRHMLHAGNRRRCWNHFVIQRTSQAIRSRRTLFLRFVSYSSALCHLAWAPHS